MPNPDRGRNELIEELWKKFGCKCGCGQLSTDEDTLEKIVDWIIEDRKRLLCEIRDARLNYSHDREIFPLIVAIDRTFTNAGVER